ncbi:MAG: endonuclease domain-containing protein [Chloroflexota bacterium]|nr:endonuclease domain-containing protein [Chloroflexota bacterium]
MTNDFPKISVSPALKQRMVEAARHLRAEQTPSEEILWQSLRNRRLNGWKFRRQFPIGAFVLDFYCAESRLAVEVDGAIHRQQVEADTMRQSLLEELGIRFVRVTADQVEQDIVGVLRVILAAMER